MTRIFIAIASVMLASTAMAADKVAAGTTKCEKKSGSMTQTRTVEIKLTDGGGCRVYLTRDDGKANEVGHADHKTEVCPTVRDKILESLKGSGFTCG